ncbi:uncharacterized protein [Amphiura filiformis]|uniref:uncharacterized protein n=1 Tax=Amphiura filiformis TaxID=82378 RepID=UPI003B227343
MYEQVCLLTKRLNPTGVMQWSLPYKGRCFCQIVLAPRSQICHRNEQEEDSFWFTSDHEALIQRENWTPHKLDILLERTGYCDVDECSSDPCHNGATCYDRINMYICVCSEGYNGTYCEFDIQSPEITNIPDNIIVYLPNGTYSAAINWTQPLATDNSGILSLTWTHSSGEDFYIGVTNVSYTAVDGSGHEVTIEFFVFVFPVPYWSEWTDWSKCGPCGTRQQRRTRTCHKHQLSNITCTGESLESKTCLIRDWCRADTQCGPNQNSENGLPGKCYSGCCSPWGWCGNSGTHCGSGNLGDYRCCTGLTCDGPC